MLSMDKRLELWEKELPQDKLALIAHAVNEGIKQEVNKKVDHQIYTINEYVHVSISAAIFEILGLSISEVNEILKKSNEFMKEAESYLLKYGEDWIMQIEKIRPQIEAMVKQGLKDIKVNKTNKLEVIKAIQKKFKDTPAASIDKIYMEVKEKEYNESCPSQYMPNEVKNKAKLEGKETGQAIAPKKENKSNMKPIEGEKNTFEVVEKKIKFKGEYHDYEKDKSGLKAGAEFFKNLEEIEAFRIKETEEFEKRISEVIAAFSFEG